MTLFDAKGWYTKAVNYMTGQWHSPNFGFPNTGDHGALARVAVVLHVTDGDDSRGWLCNPASQVSATFLIREEGTYQMVSIYDAHYANGIWEPGHAWHGTPDNVNPNRTTISIEREGHPQHPVSAHIDALTVQLLRDLQEPFPQFKPYVPLQNLIGHFMISPHHRPNCPGPTVDFPGLALAANGGGMSSPPFDRPVSHYVVRAGVIGVIRSSAHLSLAGKDTRVGELASGTSVAGAEVDGDYVRGSGKWLQLSDNRGYVHLSALALAPQPVA